MLWKESLCKTWIVFILIKCICFIIKINHVLSHVKKTLLLKINIVFQINPLFSAKTHCFSTCALFYPIVLKRKIITGHSKNLQLGTRIFTQLYTHYFVCNEVHTVIHHFAKVWHQAVLWNNKKAQRALGRSPVEKVKGHSGANNREPQGE